MIAAFRQARLDPGSRFGEVRVINTETSFEIDPDEDLLDYWGLE